METVSGSNNWKIVFRRENGGITLLQAVTNTQVSREGGLGQ